MTAIRSDLPRSTWTQMARAAHASVLPSSEDVSPRCPLPRRVAQIRSGYGVLRIVLGVIVLVAAGLKAHQLATEPVSAAGLLESRWFQIAVVEFELLLGLSLLTGICAGHVWRLTLACFVLFTCVSLYKAGSGHATCGCFGRVPVNPWYTAAFDSAVVFSLLCWRPTITGAFHRSFVRYGHIAVLVCWLLISIPLAVVTGTYAETVLTDAGDDLGNGGIVVLKPETWIGKRLPLLDHIDIGDKLKEGNWLVLLYRHDCPSCEVAFHTIRRLSDEQPSYYVAIVELPPYGNVQGVAYMSQASLIGRVSSSQEWFMTTPLIIELRQAEVARVAMRGDSDSQVRPLAAALIETALRPIGSRGSGD